LNASASTVLLTTVVGIGTSTAWFLTETRCVGGQILTPSQHSGEVHAAVALGIALTDTQTMADVVMIDRGMTATGIEDPTIAETKTGGAGEVYNTRKLGEQKERERSRVVIIAKT